MKIINIFILASLSSISTPTDLWIPSAESIKPQYSKQIAIGLFKNLKDNNWETSLEFYSKKMENLIEYKEGVFPEDNTNESQEGSFTFGSGTSKGIEVFIKKVKRKINWMDWLYIFEN